MENLCEDPSVKVEDTLFVRTQSGNKESKIFEVMELYEDELPFPLAKDEENSFYKTFFKGRILSHCLICRRKI